MATWFRWQGLVAFFVLSCGGALFLLLFADTIVKRFIERTGTHLVGVTVELDGADLSFFPLAVSLKGLQVTNPEEPTANALEVAQISAALDGPGLLRRKVIVGEMSAAGIRLNTPRKSPGIVSGAPVHPGRKGEKPPNFEFFSLDLPGVEKVVEHADLQSLKLVTALQAESRRAKDRWQKRLTELPGREQAEDYRKRVGALKSTVGGGSAQGLRRDIQREVEKVSAAQQEFAAEIASLRQRVAQMERAPLEDFRRLREQYGASPQGLTNFSQLFFGPRVNLWIERAVLWHERLQPFLQRIGSQRGDVEVVKPLYGSGLDVRFREQRPLPDLLVRLLKASVLVQTGEITGQIRNLTPDLDLHGQPMSFAFVGEKLTDGLFLTLDGEVDRISRSKPRDTVTLRVEGFRVENEVISEFAGFPVAILEGAGNLDVRASFKNNGIFLDLSLALDPARFSVEQGKGSALIGEALSSALGQAQRCSLKASVRGTVKDYRVNITSDLEDVLKEAVAAQVKARFAKVEEQVRSAMAAKLAGPFQEVRGNMEGLAVVAGELENRLTQLTALAKELPP